MARSGPAEGESEKKQAAMILFDTDTLSIVQSPHLPEAQRLQARIAALPEEEVVATTIVTYEEQTRGWLDFMAKARTLELQMEAYGRLLRHLEFFTRIHVVSFDPAAGAQFERLLKLKIRIGTRDLRIASIAVARGALLLSRNRRHFDKVPGLRLEDWTRSLGPDA
jgi:tRNA(fMet)-specific endonuclease VapC